MSDTLHVVHLISSLSRGGAEAVLCDLVVGLHKKGYTQQVIYFHDGPLRLCIEQLGIKVHHVTGLICLYDPFFWWRIYRTLWSVRPRIIHASLWSAGFVGRIMGKMLGIPVVTAVHAHLDHHGHLRTMLDRLSITKSDTFIAVTSDVAQSLVAAVPAIRRSAVTCIENGVDIALLDRYRDAQIITREQYGFLPEHLIIASVGRFVAVKRYDILIALFAQISKEFDHARLVLIGSGPLEQFLRNCAQQQAVADRVTFIVGKDARNYYPVMDIFVQTSQTEGLSIALLEAMAFRRACVVTGGGVHPVIMQGKNGFLAPADNLYDCRVMLKKLIDDPHLRGRVGTAARETVHSTFSTQRMVDRYEHILFENAKHAP